MNRHLIAHAACACALFGIWNATSAEASRLLLGFERAELEKHGKFDDEKGTWRPSRGYPYDLGPFSKEDKTEGEQARVKKYGKGWTTPALKNKLFETQNPGVYRRAATLLRTSGWHEAALGSDWSGFDCLRVDIKTTVAEATVAIELEDALAPFPLRRTFKLAPGKWQTLEFDLAGAASHRLLDPRQMASLYLLVLQLTGETEILVDHIRLSGAQTPCAHEILRDTSAWMDAAASSDLKPTRPEMPAVLDAAPDRSALPGPEKPVTIEGKGVAWDNALHKIPRGIGAFDNRHLASIFTCPTGGVRVSSDGGATWSGLDGKPYTIIASGNNTANRHGFFCSATEILTLYITHCAGGGSPSNTYFRRVAFDGEKWTVGEPQIVDPEVRHCPECYEVIRLNNGRLWAAWDHYNRDSRIEMVAKFSDDEGTTWQHGGNLGVVGDKVALGSQVALAAYGKDGAALLISSRHQKKVFFSVFRQNVLEELYARYRGQPEDAKLPWDRFARESAWSQTVALPVGERVQSAVGMPDGRVFAAVSKPAAVLMWDGNVWTPSLEGATGTLSRSGERLVLICEADEGKKLCYRIFADGAWSEPKTAAEEPGKIKTFAAPRVAPPNFVPVAWSVEAEKTVARIFRIALP